MPISFLSNFIAFVDDVVDSLNLLPTIINFDCGQFMGQEHFRLLVNAGSRYAWAINYIRYEQFRLLI
jgi:hypothetical protein